MYNPIAYWEHRGQDYKGIEHAAEMDYLRELWAKYVTAEMRGLEVGSGYGRIYRELRPTQEYACCDIADSMREHCRAATGIMPAKWDGQTLPYARGAFDVVLAYDVLLHVPPADIQQIISELRRVSRKYLLIGSWDVPAGVRTDHHVFAHDYDTLLPEVIERRAFGERVVRLVEPSTKTTPG